MWIQREKCVSCAGTGRQEIALKRALLNNPLVKMGRSLVKEEAKERKERGRESVWPSHWAGGVGGVLGTGERFSGRKQITPPVSPTEGKGSGTQDAGQKVGWGGVGVPGEWAGDAQETGGSRKYVMLWTKDKTAHKTHKRFPADALRIAYAGADSWSPLYHMNTFLKCRTQSHTKVWGIIPKHWQGRNEGIG